MTAGTQDRPRRASSDSVTWIRWADGEPSPEAQQALLNDLRAALQPLIARHRLPGDFLLAPGLRLRSKLGRCQFSPAGPASITVRCTAGEPPRRWRSPDGILVTFLHELAHLRHPNHRPAFWRLLRRLIDEAHASGVYDLAESGGDDPALGDGKLSGSAAHSRAEAARARRQARWEVDRDGLASWRVGDVALVVATRRTPSFRATILALRRTRAEVIDAAGRRYLVPGSLLQREKPDNT